MIPFNKPFNPRITREQSNISEDQLNKKLRKLGFPEATSFLNSATGALEVMALSIDLKPGDEVIMPSFTYAATANAFARAGAKIVFVDIEEKTLNLDPKEVEKTISNKTKAIVPIHYGGVSADLKALSKLADDCGALLLEDAAHGIGAYHNETHLGTIGDMGCISFHSTKNISCESGGVLTVKKPSLIAITEEVVHQGTNRLQFNRGKVSEYTWQRLGGEFSMHPYAKPVLNEMLDHVDKITTKRVSDWYDYQKRLVELELKGFLKLAEVPNYASINGHIFYILVENRDALSSFLFDSGIHAHSHYEPLHSSEIGKKVGCATGDMKETNRLSRQVLRLPMFYDLKSNELEFVVNQIYKFFK